MGRAVRLPLNLSPLDYVLNLIEDAPEQYLIVFPGKRPIYFLKRLLALRKGRAFFPPKTFPVEAFVREIHMNYFGRFEEPSPLQAAWISYLTGEQMGLSQFSSFGSSFFWAMRFYEAVEELEKEMVDQKKLLLSTAQPEAFLGHVEEMMGRLAEFRERFLENLRSRGMRTPGMIYRETAEAVRERGIPWDRRIILVGLSALTASEREIFKRVMEMEDSLFLFQQVEEAWDIHHYLEEWSIEKEEVKGQPCVPRIFLHAASGAHGQALSLQQVLRNLPQDIPPEETVVVLPDPSLLLPALSQGLSSYAGEYNVSVGYPITRTPVYALLDRMMELQLTRRDGLYHAGKYLEFVLHPYIKNLRLGDYEESETSRRILHSLEEKLVEMKKPFLSLKEIEEAEVDVGNIPPQLAKEHIRKINDLFIRALEGEKTLREITEAMLEALGQVWTRSPARHYPLASPFFQRFSEFLKNIRDAEFSAQPMPTHEAFSIIKHALVYERVPFEGRPLRGLQILGQLETRALRFKNVIYLSANEDALPATEPIDPLLPTAVREYLGLPTFRDRERIIKYYFFRLVKGAERVDIIYDSSEDTARSRFVEELVWEAEKQGKTLPRRTYPPVVGKRAKPLEIEKKQDILRRLEQYEFSPSSIDAYMECPLKFYLQRVVKIEEKEEIEETPEARAVGTLLHKILEEFYKPALGREVKEGDLDQARLMDILERKFKEFFPWQEGEVALLKIGMRERLRKFLEWERRNLPFEILFLEKEFTGEIPVDGRKVRITGRLDRIQRKDGKIEVIDYKLSRGKSPAKSLREPIEERKEMARRIKSFQLPLYLYLIKKNRLVDEYEESQAYLYPMGFGINEGFKPQGLWGGRSTLQPSAMEEVFIPSLENLLKEILSPEVPFSADPSDPKICQHCPFRSLCGR